MSLWARCERCGRYTPDPEGTGAAGPHEPCCPNACDNGVVPCWNPGGPCSTPPPCEFCGPCENCQIPTNGAA